MISEKHIYPPKNWQDFELLCLKLWGEIWDKTDEIDFNSDNSSGQEGVDIYCLPDGENGFYGIQCKNKMLFRKHGEKNKLSKSIIDEEIDKARGFKPPLKKLIIATSLGKDKEIEEYVREINLQHLKNNEFSVQICFWDFISRKINEYESVYNWFVKNENFNKNKSIKVTFENERDILIHKPKFIKTKVIYRIETEEEKREEFERFKEAIDKVFEEKQDNIVDRFLSLFKRQRIRLDRELKITIDGKDINSKEYIESTYPKPKIDYNLRPKLIHGTLIPQKQELGFRIKLINDGDVVIDDYKFYFYVSGNYSSIQVKTPKISELKTYVATTWINENQGLIEPPENFIVQQDSYVSKEIILTPNLDKEGDVVISWKLLSRDYNDSGKLIINIKPEYLNTEKIMYVLYDKDCKEEIEYSCFYEEGYYSLNI
jgi:hypothetical protein